MLLLIDVSATVLVVHVVLGVHPFIPLMSLMAHWMFEGSTWVARHETGWGLHQ
jgi:hypothetical protein